MGQGLEDIRGRDANVLLSGGTANSCNGGAHKDWRALVTSETLKWPFKRLNGLFGALKRLNLLTKRLKQSHNKQ
jgi:hypothetical protein